jgi:hypothetical protein
MQKEIDIRYLLLDQFLKEILALGQFKAKLLLTSMFRCDSYH